MKITTDKHIRVATLFGAVVLFEPGETKEVSSEIGLIALQEGATEVKDAAEKTTTSSVIEVEDVVEVAVEPEETTDRFEKLVEVLVKIRDQGDPDNFKADGTPRATIVNKAFGEAVLTDEREAAWQEALNSR